MPHVQVFGTGCAKCTTTAKQIQQVADALGVTITLTKVETLPEIMAAGILTTPGVSIDGRVVHSGGVPATSQIEQWLRG